MKANFERVDLIKGYEYDYFVPSADAIHRFRLSDGNLIIQDKEGRLFNVHPLISSRYNTKTRKNEDMPHSYPVRWQLMSYDVPSEIADKVC